MKLRYHLNNNADEFQADVFESKNGTKIKVCKTFIGLKFNENNIAEHELVEEWFEFSTIAEYENWLNNQEWVIKRKIKKIHDFINVKKGD